MTHPAATSSPAAAPSERAVPHRRAVDCAPDGARGRTRGVDRTLQLLLLAAERGTQLPITLSLEGGTMVTGTLVGTVAYCRELADHFSGMSGGTVMDEELAEAFRSLVDDAHGIAQGDRRHPADPASFERSVRFLHLHDARVVTPSGVLPVGRHGVLWRCRVGEVKGWALGALG